MNSETGKTYAPHNADEELFVFSDTPRYALLKGGEGSGKTTAGCIKALNRIQRRMSGICVSPDLPHFKRSLWPEFRRWCPWNLVVEEARYRGKFTWEPHQPFLLPFLNGAVIYFGGIDEPGSWEGPNISWVLFDEARRKKTADALKVLDGRIRIAGPKGEPPQLFITSTPRKHWMFRYFGGVGPEGIIELESNDPRAAFKSQARVVTLETAENIANLSEGYVEQRALSLTAAEIRVLLEAQWEDIEDTENFLPSMSLWDLCEGELPPLGPKEPMVVAMDAATGRKNAPSDCYGMIGVTRHPTSHEDVAVRFVQKWQARAGHYIDYNEEGGPIPTLRKLCAEFDVVQVAYDPTELRSVVVDLNKENLAWFFEFGQGKRRWEADRQLLDLILQRRITHNGNVDLREHIFNANRKLDADGRRLRIIKREESLKNDLAVSLSMACYEISRLNL